MSLDYSAVPRMPDGRTAAEDIAAVAATSRAVRVAMGNGGKMMWHVWGENSGKPIPPGLQQVIKHDISQTYFRRDYEGLRAQISALEPQVDALLPANPPE